MLCRRPMHVRPIPSSEVALVPAYQDETQNGQYHDDKEQYNAHGGCHPLFKPNEAFLPDIEHDACRVIAGSALGDNVNQAEDTHRLDERYRDHQGGNRKQQGKCHSPEGLPGICAVNARRLDQFVRNALQCAKKDHHGKTCLPPCRDKRDHR